MSVIAKLSIRGVSEFGVGRLVELGCICENDLMAAYAESEEDRLFTRYSPWGEIKLNQPAGYCLGGIDQDAVGKTYYVMALHVDEAGEKGPIPEAFRPDTNFPGAAVYRRARCYSLTDYGHSKRVEFQAGSGGKGVDKLNWKMTVDNPGASNQFKPGEDFWIAFYDASTHDRDKTIHAAHGHL